MSYFFPDYTECSSVGVSVQRGPIRSSSPLYGVVVKAPCVDPTASKPAPDRSQGLSSEQPLRPRGASGRRKKNTRWAAIPCTLIKIDGQGGSQDRQKKHPEADYHLAAITNPPHSKGNQRLSALRKAQPGTRRTRRWGRAVTSFMNIVQKWFA